MAKQDLQAEVERLRAWLAAIRDAGCPGLMCAEAATQALDGAAAPARGESTQAFKRRLSMDRTEKPDDKKKR